MNRRPRVGVRHDIDPITSDTLGGEFADVTPAVTVAVSFDLHDHDTAIALLEQAVDSVRRQISETKPEVRGQCTCGPNGTMASPGADHKNDCWLWTPPAATRCCSGTLMAPTGTGEGFPVRCDRGEGHPGVHLGRGPGGVAFDWSDT